MTLAKPKCCILHTCLQGVGGDGAAAAALATALARKEARGGSVGVEVVPYMDNVAAAVPR